MNTLVRPLLTGKTAAVEGQLWSAFDTPPGTYTRNPSNPMVAFDLSGLPLNSNGGLVSPKHVAFAWHAGITNPITFRASDGSVVSRGIASTTQVVPSAGIPGQDIGIATLSSAVPGTVTPLRLLPANAAAKYNPFGVRCPGLWVRWSTQVLYAGMLYFGTDDRFVRVSYPGSPPVGPNLEIPGWERAVEGGDSGSPFLTLLPDEPTPVLMSCVYGLGNISPDYSWWASEIRSVVQADGEDVTYADLSGFNDV